MKLLIVLSLLLTGCAFSLSDKPCSEPKLHFKEKVRVVNGFYTGSKGVIVGTARVYRVSECFIPSYYINIDGRTLAFQQDQLERY